LLVVAHTWDGDPVEPAERATVRVALAPTHLTIEIDAPYHGDPPPEAPVGPTDALWKHEVVELFLAHGARYTEIEVGPHGHHLVLRLDGYRHVLDERLPLDYSAHIDGGRWRGVARLVRGFLPPRPWTANAYAIHGVGGERRYLAAWPVPGPEPDFHRLACFQPLP